MDGFDVCIAGKVILVECKNPRDAVYPHGGYQSRVVNLNTRDILEDEELPPLLVHCQTVRQESKVFLEKPSPPISLGGS
jgi:hypothetical protein